MTKINVLDQDVKLYSLKEEDYISLTDIARYKDSQRTDTAWGCVCPQMTQIFADFW